MLRAHTAPRGGCAGRRRVGIRKDEADRGLGVRQEAADLGQRLVFDMDIGHDDHRQGRQPPEQRAPQLLFRPALLDQRQEPVRPAVARKAGDLIMRASDDMDRVGYQAKAAADFVTEVDIAAEKEILHQLGKAYPEHQFLCEESGPSGNEDSDYTWVIDPLDGTSNFLRGIPHYAISIACSHRGKIEHAVVYDPVRQEEFIASRGRGAQLNGHRIRIGSRHELNDSLIGTGVPFLGHCEEHLDALSCIAVCRIHDIIHGHCSRIHLVNC